MKAEPGHIRIKKKVCFEYYELEKPVYEDYVKRGDAAYYSLDLEEYEASKRSVKVSNINIWGELYEMKHFTESWLNTFSIINNQPCKAEVNGTATIIELIKE